MRKGKLVLRSLTNRTKRFDDWLKVNNSTLVFCERMVRCRVEAVLILKSVRA